jgi:hypothetical protein
MFTVYLELAIGKTSEIVCKMFFEAASCIGTRSIATGEKVITSTGCVPSLAFCHIKNISTSRAKDKVQVLVTSFMNAKHMIESASVTKQPARNTIFSIGAISSAFPMTSN